MISRARVALVFVAALVLPWPAAGVASPEDDRALLVAGFEKRFPGVPLDDYVLGGFMLSADARRHYEDIMEFPPFEVEIDRGRKLWETPFRTGSTYAQCLPQGGHMIAGFYPKFDAAEGRVITFEMLINRCRRDNGEAAYRYDDRDTMGVLTAYARTLSDGMRMQIRVDGPEALAKYEAGKALFQRRIGQMNFACSTCHVDNAGRVMRMETVSPALGQATHFPVFRGGDALYTLHARYTRCMEQVRAQPFPMGSEAFNNLEYYHSYLSNGLPLRASVYRR
ncbi:MAG: sulfur oxidation c-type cytochrome SoxA [Burkholderiales bacterium]